MNLLAVLLCTIQLSGVTGNNLRARAFFDVNNAKVGDPLILTIDFIGSAEFSDLHPPTLARHVDGRDWKLDDVSAKTDTFRDARRLTYRVRPMREGVLWFPSLEFEYDGTDGTKRMVRSNEIPVHAKVGAQVVVAEMGEDLNQMPQPPELATAYGGPAGSEDEEFAWRKACANPTADAFAQFDFPAAKMNEATCAIRDGNWARALRTYARLEWRIGQTVDIERGMVAALALKYDNPAAELPVWRQVLRPLLRHGWQGRVAIVLGGFAALALVFWLLGRCIRALACVTVTVGLALSASAQGVDPFQMIQQMQRDHQDMMNRMNQMMSVRTGGGTSTVIINGQRQEPIRVTASAQTDRKDIVVGEPFEFILSLEAPRTVAIQDVSVSTSPVPGLEFLSRHFTNLADGKSANPSNVVKRLSVSVRAMVPYRGAVTFVVSGEAVRQQFQRSRNDFFGSMSFGEPFREQTAPVALNVRPLNGADQPEGFAGVISEGLRIHELLDMMTVETNDVIQITYRMYPKGYVPDEFLPPDAAFEIFRNGEDGAYAYRRFLVADGMANTPVITIPYYDPRTKSYRTAKAGGTPIRYRSPTQDAKEQEKPHGKTD